VKLVVTFPVFFSSRVIIYYFGVAVLRPPSFLKNERVKVSHSECRFLSPRPFLRNIFAGEEGRNRFTIFGYGFLDFLTSFLFSFYNV